MITPNLTQEILYQLHQLLPICGPFESSQALRYLFADSRLALWRNLLPKAAVGNDRFLVMGQVPIS